MDKSVAWHGRRAVVENQNYQIDRLWKQNYILVNVIAEGYDQKRFIEFMVKVKSKLRKQSRFVDSDFLRVLQTPLLTLTTSQETRSRRS